MRACLVAGLALIQLGCAPALDLLGNYSVVRKGAANPADVTFSPPVEAVSTDSTYGLTQGNPIRVGGGTGGVTDGLLRYLGALAGPHRERVAFRPLGRCCPFWIPGEANKVGLLEIYEISYDGIDRPVRIFVDAYNPGLPIAPVGFTIAGVSAARP